LPDPEANGTRYLKFPLNALSGAAWEAMDEMMMMPATRSIVWTSRRPVREDLAPHCAWPDRDRVGRDYGGAHFPLLSVLSARNCNGLVKAFFRVDLSAPFKRPASENPSQQRA
jgi:hypothetical protein